MELTSAIVSGTLQDVMDLLRAGADPNEPDRLGCLPLRWAVTHGDLHKARLLIDSGADVRARDQDGNSALCSAITYDRKEMVHLLLEHGADIHGECDCGGVIAICALSNNADLLEMFASMGAEVNAYNSDGFTPLMLAAGNGAKDVIPVLLSHGAHVDLRDRNYGLTAYLHAALVNDRAAAKMLLAAGADPNATNNEGKTATELAAGNGHHWDLP